MTELTIRQLHTFAEYDACVDLQQATWQYSAGELLPRRVFFLAKKLGGHVLGAYDLDQDPAKLVGFNLGLPAQRNGMGYIHSQMLAVLPAYRNTGVGRRMKLLQQDIAREQNIQVIEWTYDPLEIKNSFFNLMRLGAISRRYIPDFYGASSSPLQGGLPTDRLYAELWVNSAHAKRAQSGEPLTEQIFERVTVPGQIYDWKSSSDPLAADTQTNLRETLTQHFRAGLCILGYEREPDGAGVFLLGETPAELRTT